MAEENDDAGKEDGMTPNVGGGCQNWCTVLVSVILASLDYVSMKLEALTVKTLFTSFPVS